MNRAAHHGGSENNASNNGTLPHTDVRKRLATTATTSTTFSDWLHNNRYDLEREQLRVGYNWLCDAMVDAPDQATFEAHITSSYDKRNWRDRHGKRGSDEGVNAYWDETKPGAPLLLITVKRFSRGKQRWNGNEVITRLWEAAKDERPRKRTAAQERAARLERAAREYNDIVAAQQRSREEGDAAQALAAALERYENAPLATKPGVYFHEKGFGDVQIPGLKRGEHPERGGYDMLPIRDAETGELTSLQYFYDQPYLNGDGEMVRKTFAYGGRTEGCAVFLSPLPPKKWAGEIATGEGVASVLSAQRGSDRSGVCYVAGLAVNNLEPVVTKLKRRCKKATLTLILDNDWQKALEVDPRTGNAKHNAGLEIGSELAMRRDLRFYMPDFTAYSGADGTLSDFNDLERVAGREAVKAQLVLRYPDPDVVFAGAREGETKRLRAVFAAHDVTVVNQRYIPADAIQEGRVNILVSPPGSGKTTLTAAHQAAHPEARRLMVNPLAALATTNAEKFGMGNYQALSDAGLRSAQQLSICQDSLPRLVAEGNPVPHYDVLQLEEPETLFGRQVGNIDTKPLVRGVMRHVVQRAKTVIITDADTDVTTLRQLERWREGERFNVVINEHPMDIDVDVYASREDVQADALATLEAGEKIAYPCSDANAAHEVHMLLQEHLELPGLYVTANNDGDAAVREFFRRPNAEAPKYSYVAYSPKIDTGLSVDAGHGYSRVFAEVSVGHDSPRRAMQRLHRFREVRRWGIYIDPAIKTYPTDREEIACRWGEGATKYDSQLLGINPEGRRGIIDPDYEAMVLDATEAENITRTNLRYNLLRRLYVRGARLRFLPPRSEPKDAESGTTLIAERKDLEKADYTQQRLEAKPITDAQALAIDRAQRRTEEQSAQLDAWRIRRTFGLLWDVPLEERHISEFRRGKLPVEVRRLELAGADQETLRGWSERQHELGEKYRADERFYGIEAHVYGSVLRVYNVDPETLTLTSDESVSATSESVKRCIDDLIAHYDEVVAAGFKLPTREQMRADPMRVIGNILRRMGGSTQTRDKVQRSRVIDTDWLEYVRDIIFERRKRREEHTEATAVNSQQGTALNVRQDAAVNIQQEATAVNVLTKEEDNTNIHCRETTEAVSILPTATELPYQDDPEAFLRATLRWIGELSERPTPELVYEAALPILTMTFREEAQEAQYEKYRSRLLDGTPLEDATPDQLRVAALGYYGWARDRSQNGVRNRGASVWLEVTKAVMSGYQLRERQV